LAVLEDPQRSGRRYRRIRAPTYVRPVGPLAYRLPRQVPESADGLCAHSDDRFRPGKRLEMEVFFPGGSSVTVVVEVVWVEALPSGFPARFDIGLRYVQVAPHDLERIAQVLEKE
jgi:hypothetical protein